MKSKTLANPTGIEIQLEILKILKDGEIHTKNEVVEKVAKHFRIKISSTNSRIDVFAKKVIGQIHIVRKNEWLKNPPQKERFAITKAGKAVVESALL